MTPTDPQLEAMGRHPLTRETLPYARDMIKRLEDRRREVVRVIDEELARIRKMITDAGLDP